MIRRMLYWMLPVLLFIAGVTGAQEATEPPSAWQTAAPMPTPRSEIAAAALDGWLYVAGGLALNASGNGWLALDAFEAYDPASDTWEARAPLPTGLHHTAMTAANGRLYAAGGYDADDFIVDVIALWAYDPQTDTWERRADLPGARAAHVLVTIDERLYLVGGEGTYSTALWIYDPTADRWDTSAAPMPTPREHLAAVALDGRLYVLGGRWRGQGNLAVVEVYDPATDSWTRLADMPTATSGFTAGAVDGRIYVVGGEALRLDATFDQHAVYDPETDTWETLPPAPLRRHGHASAVIDDRWYVVGGSTLAAGRTFTSLSRVLDVYVP